MRPIARTLAALVLAMPVSAAAASIPQTQVETFYHWYLDHADDQKQPEFLQPGMRAFVTPDLLKRLRMQYETGSLPGDVDPFLRVQDWDAADWKAHVAVSEPMGGAADPRIQVTLGRDKEPVKLCVHLRQVGENWKISQVDDRIRPGSPDSCHP